MTDFYHELVEQPFLLLIMKNAFEIIKEINELTLRIEFKFPELYRYMDENPIAMQKTNNIEMEPKVLSEYLQSLKELISRYQQSRPETI